MHPKNHTKILTLTTLILLFVLSSTCLTQAEDKPEQKSEQSSVENPETTEDILKFDDLTPEQLEKLLSLIRPQDSWAYTRTAKRLRRIKHCITVPEFERLLKNVESLNLDPDPELNHTMVYNHGFLALKDYAHDQLEDVAT